MWEQIQSNKRKSVVLVIAMAFVLLVLGYIIGESVGQGVGILGIFAAFILWVVLSLVAYFKGDNILLAVSGAKKIEKDDHPESSPGPHDSRYLFKRFITLMDEWKAAHAKV